MANVSKIYYGDSTNKAVQLYPEYIKVVPWATGTDAEIKALIDAADAGLIDLYEDAGWRVGDERTVSLSAMNADNIVGEAHVAQDVVLVLMANDTGTEDITNPCYNYQYVTAKSGRSYPSFIVGQKNGLANGTTGETGYMNSTNTNSGSWNGCARRTWCNSTYKNAMPSVFVDIFKQVKVKTAETYNGTTIQESQDYFFLPAAKEVFGGTATSAGDGTGYSNLTEYKALAQWPYYATASNRIKYCGASGSAYSWWERSPLYDYASYFCLVRSDGTAGNSDASNTRLIAPCGCI